MKYLQRVMVNHAVCEKPDIRESQSLRRNLDDLQSSRKRMNGGRFLVPGAGIEPARWLPPRDFKSLASTNSATQAQISGELQVLALPSINVFYRQASELSRLDRVGLFGTRDPRKWVDFEIDRFVVEFYGQKSYRIRPDRLSACFLIGTLNS
jgi:hypothetical protein